MPDIRNYSNDIHRPQVIQLWGDVLGYQSGHNAPALAIDKKLAVQDGLFFVALALHPIPTQAPRIHDE